MGGSGPPGQVDPKQTVSVRNLRIREDTAKYLRNLDADSGTENHNSYLKKIKKIIFSLL